MARNSYISLNILLNFLAILNLTSCSKLLESIMTDQKKYEIVLSLKIDIKNCEVKNLFGQIEYKYKCKKDKEIYISDIKKHEKSYISEIQPSCSYIDFSYVINDKIKFEHTQPSGFSRPKNVIYFYEDESFIPYKEDILNNIQSIKIISNDPLNKSCYLNFLKIKNDRQH